MSLIGDADVARIDPETGKVDVRVAVRPADSQPVGMAYDGTSLWVVDQAGDRVLELDPDTGEVRDEYPTGHEPRLVTSGPSGIFVGDYTGSSVTRVTDGDTVYLVEQEGPTVWTIDARSQEVVGELVLDVRSLPRTGLFI